ncbi:MAG TPA: undecaprenyl-diphosphate phosphatase [Dermatophilaceae bacterium]|nr:undecaprenyl-diphosphate phosphatase [Dermatophilaceae bacterium]
MQLSFLDAVILGIVEGLTEFLPVSSTGHLTITEQLLGLPIDDPAITGFTATIQIGAIAATLLYFRADITRMWRAWTSGLRDPAGRTHDYTLAWTVIIGSLPVAVVGFLAQGLIKGPLRSLWVVAFALIGWSAVMWVAEQRHDVLLAGGRQRTEKDLRIRDGLVLGLVQCFSLVPGVSRSGATISAGLWTGLDRVTSTRLSFFMAIPALTAAGLFELKDVDTAVVGWGQLAVGTGVSFVVAYASIAWLLRFVASNSLRPFVYYRVPLAVLLAVLLGVGGLSAT